jgi:hypothetical protein
MVLLYRGLILVLIAAAYFWAWWLLEEGFKAAFS